MTALQIYAMMTRINNKRQSSSILFNSFCMYVHIKYWKFSAYSCQCTVLK